MHPSEEIFCTKSNKLRGKTIIMGITGSVAAIECFATIRELIRHGAKVIPVMSPDAQGLVTPMSLEFASGNVPVTKITGKAEHVSLLGDGSVADLFLIYPATANTISKIAQGIDDTPVTTMATVAMGSGVPMVIAPAMHDSMFRNPAVQKNVDQLKRYGVMFLGPNVVDLRAKAVSKEEVIAWVFKLMSKNDLKGKKVLVIGGRSEEPIDSMRFITNRSTGRMAVSIAERAFERGAETELWMGGCSVPLPNYIPLKRFETVSELMKMVAKIKHDVVIVPAALADFGPVRPKKGKIPSGGPINVELVPVPKVLPAIRTKCRRVIGFKAESGLDRDTLIAKAKERMDSYDLAAIVANDIDVAGKITSNVVIVTKDAAKDVSGTKANVADSILDVCAEIL
ncbi:MAG: bifunctional phosphopantothenoylcysteine decarboxylase/phosphopantothenate--cysteine ligase CoaBC [Methanomassiliicoccaceae archaeon]|jgi:phosphopantothenoylcysteine decarboxylase/phosphopantothenate--cysteine ligase|nr:bifunctional phosphopantothenoylcysteine decarboxylase/phosphopantothenate--cysteine ligase CoaBC [Methanomassiliicoccaceae archaeon]